MKGARVVVAISPAILVLMTTLIISSLTGYPEGLFLTRSIRGISTRFVIITLVLVAPIWASPRFLSWIGSVARRRGPFGQLVKVDTDTEQEFKASTFWVLRPLQGIGLSLVFAERLLQLLEFSGATPSRLLVRLTLFVLGASLVSLLLSTVWTLDELEIRIYNEKTGEVHAAGSTVGTVLPLIAGAVGVTTLFQHTTIGAALVDLFGISMILYPPYVLYAVAHREFIRRKRVTLLESLSLKRIETKVS